MKQKLTCCCSATKTGLLICISLILSKLPLPLSLPFSPSGLGCFFPTTGRCFPFITFCPSLPMSAHFICLLLPGHAFPLNFHLFDVLYHFICVRICVKTCFSCHLVHVSKQLHDIIMVRNPIWYCVFSGCIATSNRTVSQDSLLLSKHDAQPN